VQVLLLSPSRFFPPTVQPSVLFLSLLLSIHIALGCVLFMHACSPFLSAPRSAD
jgi:hypothetical protein